MSTMVMSYQRGQGREPGGAFERPAVIAALACILLMLLAPMAAAQDDGAPEAEDRHIVPGSLLRFDDSVRLALRQSPYFVQSALQIELQRIDESDATYNMFPDIIISSRYVITNPGGNEPYDLSFDTGAYDPFTAYFSMKASRLATRMAVLGHLAAISDGLRNIAQGYLEVDAYNRLAAYQDELIALANHQSAFVNNRVETGGASPIEARIAKQHIELATLEREALDIRMEGALDRLKGYLGLKSEEELALDLNGVREQVLESFDLADTSFKATVANNIELQIIQLKQELQEYNVALAYAKFIPTFSARVGTPDALTDTDGDIQVSIRASTPLWDWGERFRNVTRQRLVQNKYGAEADLVRVELERNWNELVSTIRTAKAELDLAVAQGELRELERRQAEIRYHSGTIAFPEYLNSIKQYFDAQKTVINKELAYDSSLLGLRFLSGELYARYVDADVF